MIRFFPLIVRLREADTIFRNTVAAMFPEVVKEKPPPPPDPYAGGDEAEEKERCYEEYKLLFEEAEDFVYQNPYNYDFDWRQVLEGECRTLYSHVSALADKARVDSLVESNLDSLSLFCRREGQTAPLR